MNPKIVDYKTIRAFESEKSKFDDMVLESICAGWQPFASPYTVTSGSHTTTFFQAMVRYEEQERAEAQEVTKQEPKKVEGTESRTDQVK